MRVHTHMPPVVRRVLAGFAAVAMLAALGACNRSGSESSGGTAKPTIGVVVKTLAQPYWLYVQAGAKAGAKSSGATMQIAAATTEQDVQEQVNKVRTMITKGVDALAVAPTEPKQLQPVLQQAVDQDIPVLLIDTDIAGWDGKTTFIGTDNFHAGVQAGEYAKKKRSSATAAILAGVPGNTATGNRGKGFRKAIKGSGIKVVSELAANSDRAKGRSVTSDILQAHPDVTMIFAENDEMALGAVQAVKAAGKSQQDVTVIGVDGTADAVQAIKKGAMDATVAQNPYKIGKVGVEDAVKVVQGKQIDKRINTGVTLVTAKNAQKYGAKLKKQLGK